MRDIEFRAWDQYHNEMIEDDSKFFITFEGTVCQQQYVEEAPSPLDGLLLMQYTGLNDKNGNEIYDQDIVKYRWGGVLSYGVIEWNTDSYSCNKGWFIKCWCGSKPYGYDCETISWDQLEVVGNTFEDADFLETIKYGVTNGGKPRTRDGIKSIIMTSLKKEKRQFNGWIPSQVNIHDSGIMDSELGNELRDELVKEGKLLQDPTRLWMVKIND